MLQQQRGFLVAAQPHRQFGQHAQRRHVAGLAGQPRPQAGFGLRQVATRKRVGGHHQRGVVRAVSHMLEVGDVGAIVVAGGEAQVGQRQPRTGQGRLQRNRAFGAGQRIHPPPCTGLRPGQFQPGHGRTRLRARQPVEPPLRGIEIALRGVGHAQYQFGAGMPGRGRQHLAGLFRGQRRVG